MNIRHLFPLFTCCFAVLSFTAHSGGKTILFERDFTLGEKAIDKDEQALFRNIELLPEGKNGGLIAVCEGIYSSYQIPVSLNLKEGSIELTIAPIVAMSFFDDGRKHFSLTLLEAAFPDQSRWQISAIISPSCQTISLRMGNLSISKKIHSWKKHQAHTLKLSWEGQRHRIWLDEQLIDEATSKGLTEQPSLLSISGYNNSLFTIRKVRIDGGK